MMITRTHSAPSRADSEIVRRIVDELVESHVPLEEVTLEEMKARIADALLERRGARPHNRLVGACCCDPALHG